MLWIVLLPSCSPKCDKPQAGFGQLVEQLSTFSFSSYFNTIGNVSLANQITRLTLIQNVVGRMTATQSKVVSANLIKVTASLSFFVTFNERVITTNSYNGNKTDLKAEFDIAPEGAVFVLKSFTFTDPTTDFTTNSSVLDKAAEQKDLALALQEYVKDHVSKLNQTIKATLVNLLPSLSPSLSLIAKTLQAPMSLAPVALSFDQTHLSLQLDGTANGDSQKCGEVQIPTATARSVFVQRALLYSAFDNLLSQGLYSKVAVTGQSWPNRDFSYSCIELEDISAEAAAACPGKKSKLAVSCGIKDYIISAGLIADTNWQCAVSSQGKAFFTLTMGLQFALTFGSAASFSYTFKELTNFDIAGTFKIDSKDTARGIVTAGLRALTAGSFLSVSPLAGLNNPATTLDDDFFKIAEMSQTQVRVQA